MKAAPLLLAISLIANGALVYAVISARDASRVSAATQSPSAAPSDAKSGDKGHAEKAAAAEALATAVNRGDAAAVRDHLRSLGLPDDVVRAAVRAVLFKPVAELGREVSKKQNKDGQSYWRGPTGMLVPQLLDKEDRARLREMQRNANRQLEELLGPDPYDPNASRYAFLPAEKASRLREIDMDYSELRNQIMSEVEGFRMPSDDEKLALLQQEQRKDLEALLSPEELAEYDRRNSNTANRLRWQMRSFEPTEEEYKTIYALTKAYDDQFDRQRGEPRRNDPNEATRRMDAQRQLNEQLKAALGEKRFAEYMRVQDPDYNSLAAAARRFDLPQPAVEKAYAARDQAVAAAQRITSDANLTPEQRSAALAAVAEQTRAQVQSALGAEVSAAYLRSNMRWLEALERGQSISVNPNGSISAVRNAPTSPNGPWSGPPSFNTPTPRPRG
jgi:hypothetical protein